VSPRALVVSHRTQKGSCPENTLAGIDAALAEGVDAIECDVRATADGVVVLMHDASLQRTTGDLRLLSEVTSVELASMVRVRDPLGGLATQPVPTLAEALARVAGRAILVIEVKDAGIEERVADAVRNAGAGEWCWIWAFDAEVAMACRAALPEVPAALNVGVGDQERLESICALAVREGFAGVSLDHHLVTAESVAAARRHALEVYTWTVNVPEDIERVLDAGVDAVCGDFPDRIRDALEERATRSQKWA